MKTTRLPDGWMQVAEGGSVTRLLRRGPKVYQAEAGGRLTRMEYQTFFESVQVVP